MGEAPRILVVDDDPSICLVAAACLERIGSYEVVTAGSAASALLILDQKAVDLVLLDVRLGSDDGIDVLHRLRQRPAGRHIPVAFFTACVLPEERERLMAQGVVGLVEKPFDPEGLCAAVSEWLASGIQDTGCRPDWPDVVDELWIRAVPGIRDDLDALSNMAEASSQWGPQEREGAASVSHRLAGVLGVLGQAEAGRLAASFSGLSSGGSVDADDRDRCRRMVADIRRMIDLSSPSTTSPSGGIRR